MDDRELKELLLRIPRESASADFSARLSRRLDAADRRARARRRAVPVLAFAAAILVAAATGLLYNWQRREALREERTEQARLANLELEYRDIEEELVELQRLVAAAQPVVGIEGPGGDRGYLLDVGELARARDEGMVPVAYKLPH
jgi:hypothetical protein